LGRALPDAALPIQQLQSLRSLHAQLSQAQGLQVQGSQRQPRFAASKALFSMSFFTSFLHLARKWTIAL
jgi:hypothetical protein